MCRKPCVLSKVCYFALSVGVHVKSTVYIHMSHNQTFGGDRCVKKIRIYYMCMSVACTLTVLCMFMLMYVGMLDSASALPFSLQLKGCQGSCCCSNIMQ